jgi:hypothetical protein
MPSPLRDGHDWRAALILRSVLRFVTRHARPVALAIRITGDGFLSSPSPLLAAADQCLRRPPDVRPDRNRHLATAFRSPRTTACFQTAILGSKFPAYRFNALLNYQQSRSARGYFALPG